MRCEKTHGIKEKKTYAIRMESLSKHDKLETNIISLAFMAISLLLGRGPLTTGTLSHNTNFIPGFLLQSKFSDSLPEVLLLNSCAHGFYL